MSNFEDFETDTDDAVSCDEVSDSIMSNLPDWLEPDENEIDIIIADTGKRFKLTVQEV